ncbi:MAG: cytochrome c-type biogenesis CcmF C-terminal domain-containing protein, partial [Chloroflexota bacterium]|nr:cytochrome c-type biogenesis CcmF C-terminal domain-containing protein [Chloroflexota bacterium]
MIAEIGTAALALSLAAAIYSIIASVIGARERDSRLIDSGRMAGLLTFPLISVASVALLAALLTQQYQIAYVWTVSAPDTPDFFRITALWGSQQGSLLFWSLLMSLFAFVALWTHWRAYRPLMPYVTAFTMATLAFFLAISLFMENPFARFWITPGLAPDAGVPSYTLIPPDATAPDALLLAQTARGLNPLLRHFGMIIHPPMLYLGFVGFTIPFAFAMSALASGDVSVNWIKATRRWTLIAWLFLSLGLILGGRWAYDVLGWGGYWGWDPVENAALLPWLIGTGFLHSVMIQEKRGMLKVWNMFLVVFTFSAVIFGTFATRSGLVESVHSFAQSEIGIPMFLFWAAMTLIAVYLILLRWRQGVLKDEHAFAGILSRESLFVLNNVIFVALTLAIFWGSFGAPILSELFAGTEITLGAEYFNLVTAPLFLVLYLLMGIAPLAAWGAMSFGRLGRSLLRPLIGTGVALVVVYLLGARSLGALVGYGAVLFAAIVALWEIGRGAVARRTATGDSLVMAVIHIFGRNRRRYGGFIVHLGISVIGIGVIGSTLYQQETQRTLRPGESLEFGGYTLTYERMLSGQIADDGRIMDIAEMRVARGGADLALLRPRYDFYPEAQGMNTQIIAGAYSTLENDVYVLLSGFENGDGTTAPTATFKFYINPLINLV